MPRYKLVWGSGNDSVERSGNIRPSFGANGAADNALLAPHYSLFPSVALPSDETNVLAPDKRIMADIFAKVRGIAFRNVSLFSFCLTLLSTSCTHHIAIWYL
ncbi:unnamed protein product [Protopolystoma xenopodis]|uniref:Uncharacterized protein n=1 Tax=Protopolystoma xenopodis TaxID=117903 RepID=A0A3S5CNT6_9PLAT|nr:unnamed protein product [Protopolystoma xenopodis]